MNRFASALLALSLSACATAQNSTQAAPFAESRIPASEDLSTHPSFENPLRVFLGSSKPLDRTGLVVCPACDENHFARDNDDRIIRDQPLAEEKFQPDTLYSWMKLEYAKSRLDSLKSSNWEGLWHPLFLTRAPLSSYPYGLVSLRVKLKPGIKFRSEQNHCLVSPSEAESTVYFHSSVMTEFLICSPKVIESVSFAAKTHYDEMIRDYFQHKTNPAGASYYMRMGASADKGFFDSGESCPDGVCYREAALLENLKATLKFIFDGQSYLLYNKDTPLSERTAAKHFQTLHPMYFNPE